MNQPAPPSKGLKIRLSCDSCQRSKIRCGQERPTCRRCLKYGIDCVYSPSRRAGRPRTRKTATDAALPASKQQQQQQQQKQQQQEQQQEQQQQPPALSTPATTSPRPEQCSPPPSPHGEDTIVVATTQPPVAVAATTTPPPALMQFVENSPDQSVPANHVDLTNGRHESFPDLIRYNGTDIFAMFPDVSHHQTPHVHQDPALDFNFLLSPLETIDFGPQESSLDCFATSNLTPVAVSAASSESGASQPNAPECNCSVTLLEQLAQLPGADSQSGELTSIASAVSRSRTLLDQCHSVLCCSRCAPRFSSVLMVCEAIDKVSVALDMGPLWDNANRDCLSGGRSSAISANLTRDDSPLRCGSYTIGGGDRRVVLRVLITKRLTELQAIMTKLQTALQSPAIVHSALHKPCVDLVSEFAAKLTSNINLVKVHL